MTGTQDEHAIHAIVKTMEEAWNAGDATAFCAHMTDDVDFIDVLGRHHTGKAVVEGGHRGIFSTIYKGSTVTYTVEKLRPVSDGVAIAFVRARLMTTLAGGADDPDRENRAPGALREEGARPTLTLVREDGVWRIAVFQNTRVA